MIIRFQIGFICLLMVFLYSIPISAQYKYERESRLNTKEVPKEAKRFIDSLPVEKKIKWYREEGYNRTSVEAKFKMKGKKYSVEFDTLGNLEDIEILYKWDEIPSTVRNTIDLNLKKDCKKYKIRRLQIQYSGDADVLLAKIKSREPSESYHTNYEIVVRCCNERDVNLFEYLFDDSGEVQSSSLIIFKNSSHLEY